MDDVKLAKLIISLIFILSVANLMGAPAPYRSVHDNSKNRRYVPGSKVISPQLKVRIAKNQKNVLIEGLDLKKRLRNKIKKYPGRAKVKFNCNTGPQLKADNRIAKPTLFASLSSPTGIISWNKKHYRGELRVATNESNTSCDLVYTTSMENYISALLSKEMQANWPLEALKAQAVAARTYALDKLRKSINSNEEIFDLENSEKHQVHGTFFDESIKTRKAADQTGGYVLTNKSGDLVPAFFHSKCGGRTFMPEKIWANPVDGYTAVKCPYCKTHGKENWSRWFSRDRMAQIFTKAIGNKKLDAKTLKKFLHVLPSKGDSTEIRFYVDGKMAKVKKSKIRKILGRNILPSNFFTLKQTEKGFRVYGAGYGHGVGLCQFGAFEMARKGMTYKQILSHYYPNLKLTKVY